MTENATSSRPATAPAMPAAVPSAARRKEDLRLVTGQGRFIDDLPCSPRMLQAAILRSPYAHARIRRVDMAAALRVPGVAAAYSGSDLAKVLDPFPNIVRSAPPYRAMAVDRVRYVGEPVAVVLATDRYRAEDGLDAIAVDYDMLPAVVDPEAACAPDAPLLHDGCDGNVAWSRHYRYGDPEAAFAEAARIVRLRLGFPKYNSTPLETYGVVAAFDRIEERYEIRANFQGPFSLAFVLAKALRVPDSRVGIIVPEEIGGSFGNKAMIYPYMALAAACARLSGRPVKWIEDRAEHLLGSASGTDRITFAEAAVDEDGRIRAVRTRILENVGAYLRAPEPSCVMRSLTTFSGPYQIDHGDIDVRCVVTNKLPTGLNRGYGGQQHAFTLERLVDAVARELALDPIEVRRRNFVPKSAFPYRTTTGSLYDSGDYHGGLEAALERAGYAALRAEQERQRAAGRLVGIGVATMVHSAASNIGYVTLALEPAERARPGYQPKSGTNDSATIALDPSGRVRVRIGTAGAGQGHATAAAQLVAARLGIEVDDVDVVDLVDTATAPWSVTSGTYASRFMVAVGGALVRGADRLRDNILALAGELLEAAPNDLEIADGRVRVRGVPDHAISLRRLAGAAYWNRGALADPSMAQLAVSESYGAPNLAPPDGEDRVNAAATYGFMADLAVVEVDRGSFVPRVLKYVAVHDVGNTINATLLRGQMAGGILHGIAGALYEHCDYDAEGQMLTGSLMEYLCPTACEAPDLVIDHHNVPSPYTALGVKGAGENSAMSAPAAIAAAIEDALQPFGARVTELPLTPAMLWRLAQAQAVAP